MAELKYTSAQGASLAAPDLTKAGELFSNALKGLATTAQQFQTGREQAALENIQRGVSTAQTQEDLAAVQQNLLPRLGEINASPMDITAAEAALRGRQLDILGRTEQEAYDERARQGVDIIQQQYAQLDPKYQNLIAIDRAGNILPKKAQPAVMDAQGKIITPAITQAEIDEAATTFRKSLTDAGYQESLTDRELTARIKEQAKQFNATPEQTKALQDSILAYRQGKQDLKPDELKILNAEEAKHNLNLELALSQLEQQKQNDISNLLYTSGEAQDLLRIKDSHLYDLVEGKYPKEISNLNIFRTWTGKKSGIDLKEYIKDKLEEGYAPWEVFLGIQAVGDTEKDWENVDSGELDAFLKSTKGKTTKDQLDQAAELDTKYEQERNILTAKMSENKLRAMARIRGEEFNIRDPAINRAFMRAYEKAQQSLEKVETSGPDPIVSTKPAPSFSTDPTSFNPDGSSDVLGLPPMGDLVAKFDDSDIFTIDFTQDVLKEIQDRDDFVDFTSGRIITRNPFGGPIQVLTATTPQSFPSLEAAQVFLAKEYMKQKAAKTSPSIAQKIDKAIEKVQKNKSKTNEIPLMQRNLLELLKEMFQGDDSQTVTPLSDVPTAVSP